MDIQGTGSVAQAGNVSSIGVGGGKLVVAEVVTSAARAVEAPATAVQATAPVTDLAQVKQAVKAINDAVKMLSTGVEFSVDENTKGTVVKVVDTQTHDVIRQMPSEEALAIAKALDKLQGLIIRQKA